MTARSFCPVCLTALCCLVVAGCGRGGPELVNIKGKVTYGGGPWPAKGALYFNPVDPAEGMPRISSRADFDTDGNFAVTSFDDGDGLVPGKYTVVVECWDSPPEPGKPSKSYVPKRYQTSRTSDLEVVIKSGAGTQEVTLDVPKQ